MQDEVVIPPVFYLDGSPVDSATPPDVFTSQPVDLSDLSSVTAAPFGGAMQTLNNFTLMELIQMFIVYAFIIAGALSALFIFIGGISFILSGGDDAKIKTAVNTIRYSIVGLIITILSFTFAMIVGRIFGLNLLDYISYEQIKCSINRVIQFGEDPTSTSCSKEILFPNR